ncbi:hypothetical protein ACIGO6_28490 [Streptomyces sp. NPDC053750]|uniref:hypothetical protein n=1 Tax=Streptomyces sp. NPDC053750 TaxID=3365714 RepID=UPI0037D37407
MLFVTIGGRTWARVIAARATGGRRAESRGTVPRADPGRGDPCAAARRRTADRSTVSVARDRLPTADARPVAERWTATGQWQIASVEARNGIVVIGVLGLPPQPAPDALRAALGDHGMGYADLELHLVGGRTHWCPADTDTCSTRRGKRS